MPRVVRFVTDASMKGLRAVVTGGAGFIGSELTRQLVQRGVAVTVLDNFASGKKEYLAGLPVRIVEGDICDKEKVAETLKDQAIVYHVAALPFIPDSYANPEEFFRVNVEGTIALMRHAIESESVERFVYLSSSEVYGTAQTVPMAEDHPTLPRSTYAVSKLAADRTVFTLYREHGLPSVIVRLFNSYGPNITQPYIVPEIALQLLEGKGILKLGNVDSSRDFTFVEDSVRAIILSSLSKDAIGEVINVGSGEDVTIIRLARYIASVVGSEFSLENDPSRFRPYDVDRLVCDNSKAKRVLGWEPKVELQEGLRRTVHWIRKHPVTFKAPFRGCAAWYRTPRLPASRRSEP